MNQGNEKAMEDYDSLASNVSNLDVCVSHVNVMTTTIVEGQLAYMLFLGLIISLFK